MQEKPTIGSVGGQHFEIVPASQNLLQSLAEGNPVVVLAVMKELLQNTGVGVWRSWP